MLSPDFAEMAKCPLSIIVICKKVANALLIIQLKDSGGDLYDVSFLHVTTPS